MHRVASPKGYRDAMTRVGVFGAAGRMGATVCAAVLEAADLELVAAVDPAAAGRPLQEIAGCGGSRLEIAASADAVGAGGADVAVDFTVASAGAGTSAGAPTTAFMQFAGRRDSTTPTSGACGHRSRGTRTQSWRRTSPSVPR